MVLITRDNEIVTGMAGRIEYIRATDVLTLTDNAQLKGESLSMTSDEIVYDVDAERLKSSGGGGVEMILERDSL